MSGHPKRSSRLHVARSPGFTSRRAKALSIAALACCAVVAAFTVPLPSAVAGQTDMVDLGAAATYAVLSGASVGNTVSAVGAPHTTLRGDLGVKANTQPTGFPPGVVTGSTAIGNAASAEAHADLVSAYDEVAGRSGGSPLQLALAGLVIPPGLHTIAGAVSNTTTVTLDGGGDPNAVFVFQVDGAMAMAAGSHVVLINGARASRVFWQVNGAGAIGANADFAGTLMAMDAVAVGAGSLVNGRTFARNGALTLNANEFYSAPPVVTIDGGASAPTTDTTPAISGTTDVEAPAVVTVTINGQTLTATPAGGAWSVTSPILANATYPVVASVSDGAGNPGSATQQLTVDTVLPIVALDGGSSGTTNDPTPTIGGISDAAPGTIVFVAVGAQVLTALVQTGGTWNVVPGALLDGTYVVTASVSDPAGNAGTDSRALVVDTAAPSVTITGGTALLTGDATPAISGTAGVTPGTVVAVTLADETLQASVQSDGTWSVTTSTLSEGAHRVVAAVSDAAGNLASVTQILTVATAGVAPPLAVDAGRPPLGSLDAVAMTIVTCDRSQKLKRSSLAIAARVAAPAGGRVVATATGTVKIAGVTRTILLTTRAAAVAAGQSATLTFRPAGTAKARRAAFLRVKSAVDMGWKVTATLTIKIVGAAGNTRQIRRTVTLT